MGFGLTMPDTAETPEDDAVASVGLVEKKTWAFASPDAPFVLENKQTLPQVVIAYETYGTLNAARDNVILITHGVTGSSHAAGKYATANRTTGYWDGLIGPGKVFDTRRFFVVAPNALGGCRGTTGPASINPETSKPYNLSFPIVTIRDMVRVQAEFLRECFGIEKLALVAGGSMGGMQALEWAVIYPDAVRAVLPIAACARLSARGIGFNEIARRAIRLDPKWNSGDYAPGNGPDAGLALARMVATMTYLTDEVLEQQFGRKAAGEESALERDLHARFDVERFLHEEGDALVSRFDANAYLYLTKAVDLHDISRGYGSLVDALSRITAHALFVGIRSDELFSPRDFEEAARLLQTCRRPHQFVEYHLMDSAYGHDAFLVEQNALRPVLRAFMESVGL